MRTSTSACPSPRLSRSLLGTIKVLVVGLIVLGTVMVAPRQAGATVPTGFADGLVVTVAAPTDIAFLPSGELLVTSQRGQLYIREGTTLKQMIDLASIVCSDYERGLLSMAVDPNYASNRLLYLGYTYKKNGNCNRNAADGPVNRVSRFVVSANNTIDRFSEVVLLDNMPSGAGIHEVGGMQFGKDGYLYVGIGDAGCQLGAGGVNCAGNNPNARLRNVLTGKILRVDRNGVAPESNPFYSQGASCRTTGRTDSATHCRETFAWGLRNPFKLAMDPNSSSTRFFINDVGNNHWEEIDQGQAGADYGWNNCEGNHDRGTWSDGCGSAHTPPIYEYPHSDCSSVTGGAFAPNGAFPSAYNGRYFFADYKCGRIWSLRQSGSRYERVEFASGLGAVTELTFGPYGDKTALYYANYGTSQIRRIYHTADLNTAPVADASATPTLGELPLRVQFDATGSTDPDGDPLTYEWSFGDGDTSRSARPVNTYTKKGVYSVRLTVRDGKGGSDTDTLQVLAGYERPRPVIESPTVSDRFSVNQVVTLTGSATDSDGNPIPDNRLTWEVIRHHDTHTHPLMPPTVGNNIQLIAPAPEDLLAASNSFLEIRLTARDSNGIGKRISQRFDPLKIDTTFETTVPELKIEIEGQSFLTPFTVTTWAGDTLTVNAPDQIGVDNQPYRYTGWSDGGRRVHDIVIPASPTTYTAGYAVFSGTASAPLSDARVREAAPSFSDGSSTGLSVKGGTTSDFETLLRFRVTGVNGGTVHKAILYLYAYDGTVDGPAIYQTSARWRESAVTWSTRPGPVSRQLDNVGQIFSRTWVAYDVTDAIRGDGTVSFLIRGSTTDAVSWYSREASANQPRLVVNATPGAGTVETPPEPTPVATVDATPVAIETPTSVPTVLPTETPIAVETPTPEPTEAPPALPFREGFEGDLSAWHVEGAAIVPGAGADGSSALQLTGDGSTESSGTAGYALHALSEPQRDLYVSLDVRIEAQGELPIRLLTLYTPDGDELASAFSDPDGALGIQYAATGETYGLTELAVGVWTTIELHLVITEAELGVEIWANGTLARRDVLATSATAGIGVIQLGHHTTDRSFSLTVDNVAMDLQCTRTCSPPTEPTPEPTATTVPDSATEEASLTETPTEADISLADEAELDETHEHMQDD